MEKDDVFTNWRAEHKQNVYLSPGKNEDKKEQIINSSYKTLLLLESWPENKPIPQKFIEAAAKAIGQFSYFSPYTLPSLEDIIIPYLKKGLLSHDNLGPSDFKYNFGVRYARDSKDLNILRQMHNGQLLTHRYHLNYPLYFNRLLSEADTIDSLIIGGGENCECGSGKEKHPKNCFYSIDIDNEHQPDVVAHACYLEHLHYFPSERFGFIWFEHYTPVEMLHDHKVINQYFRIAKPGCIFLFQSNFLAPNDHHSQDAIKHGFEQFSNELLKIKISTLERPSLKKTSRKGNEHIFVQMILMKPMHIKDQPYFKVENGPIINLDPKTLEAFKMPTISEKRVGLILAKVLSKQEQFILNFPLEEILDWVNNKH